MVGQKSSKVQSVFFHIFSCLLGFIMVYPLLWLLMSSFKSNDTMFHNAWSLIPEKWDALMNYSSGWEGIAGIPFWRFTLNSVIVTVVSVVGTIFCSLLAAYAVSRLKFRGANFWSFQNQNGCTPRKRLLISNRPYTKPSVSAAVSKSELLCTCRQKHSGARSLSLTRWTASPGASVSVNTAFISRYRAETAYWMGFVSSQKTIWLLRLRIIRVPLF